MLFGADFHLLTMIGYQERECPSYSELVRVADEALLALCSGEVLSVIVENRRNVFGDVKVKKEDLAGN